MGGWGKCPCCKKNKDLTEHHAKELNNKKVMICLDCHRVIEEYLKVIKQLKTAK